MNTGRTVTVCAAVIAREAICKMATPAAGFPEGRHGPLGKTASGPAKSNQK